MGDIKYFQKSFSKNNMVLIKCQKFEFSLFKFTINKEITDLKKAAKAVASISVLTYKMLSHPLI